MFQTHCHSLIVAIAGMVAVASIPARADTILYYDSQAASSHLTLIGSANY